MERNQPYRFIISGGGTGGHIYPAIAIANKVKEKYADAEILFVGAIGKMEMTKVPQAGYKIIGLWISGFQRRVTLSNLYFPFKLIYSFLKARQIIKQFRPDAVVGVGGYASGPIALAAINYKIPVLIQEQNSYAGLTNKKIGKKAACICVAYEGMHKYFPEEKIVITGNPVRKDILDIAGKREEALQHYGLSGHKKTILILGGSLGARTINNSVVKNMGAILGSDVQLLWQTGKFYHEEMSQKAKKYDLTHIRVLEFIKEMDLAYAAADVVISRAGALSIAELCLVGKPVILVPSPNVAEDHQTKNAMALEKKAAAMMIRDKHAEEKMIIEALDLLKDDTRQQQLATNIQQIGYPHATEHIVNQLIKIAK